MLLTNSPSIRDVILFPLMRPREATSSDAGAEADMDLPFELFVAVRYLLARRKQAFISLISLISVLGVAVGVMALLIALALMTGLQGELRDRIVGSTAHIYVFKTGGIDDYRRRGRSGCARCRDVVGAAPAMLGQALITARERRTSPIQVKGIDAGARADGDQRRASRCRPAASTALDAGRRATARRHRARQGSRATSSASSVGDIVRSLTAQGTLTPMGMMPRTRRVQGRRHLQARALRVRLGVRLRAPRRRQALLGKDTPDYIELRVDDIYRGAGDRRRDPGAARRPTTSPQDWADMNRSLFSALWLEKMAISITIGLIVMVAALNIVASLILLVMEKSRDIAILKTMGELGGEHPADLRAAGADHRRRSAPSAGAVGG